MRSSAFFGPWDTANFAHAALDALARGARFLAASDATVSPTYIADLVSAMLDLLVDGERGVWHLATPAAITWLAFADRVARAAGVSTRTLEPFAMADVPRTAPRPRFSALSSERAILLRPLDEAITDFIRSRRALPLAFAV